MAKYIDAHCHVMNVDGAAIPDSIGFITNATNESDWPVLIKLADKYTNVFPAIGIHPWCAENASDGWDLRMMRILREYPFLTVGEVGLDRARGNMDAQMPVFVRQMEIAHAFGRVAHIHCVRAWDKLLNVFSHISLPPAIVIHACRANPDVINALTRHGNVYFSYAGGDGAPIIKSITAAPIDKILVETDGTNPIESLDKLKQIISQIAVIKNIDNVEMTDIIYNNSLRVIKNG